MYEMKCMPRFNYGRSVHTVERVSETEVIFISSGDDKTVLRLVSSVPLNISGTDVSARFTLAQTESADFLLEHVDKGHSNQRDFKSFITEMLFETVGYWKKWVAESTYTGRWQEIVHRSALVLKLLSSYNHGSIIAAATLSLPENIGGTRNFDYRFTWIRDASFSIYALIRLGYTKEAGAFIQWVEKLLKQNNGQNRLGIMYSIEGQRQLTEVTLDHFEGYMSSSPVRIGNDAYGQLQLDIYGELLDSVYLYNKYGNPISYDFWKNLEKQIDWLSDNWQQPDEGIWEVRGGRQRFLYSRLLCWVAFDRAIRIAESRSFPLNEKWRHERDTIYNSIFSEFWTRKSRPLCNTPVLKRWMHLLY
jgi:GH15 family glucan-1,4-alpha-glucosidase